MRNKQLEIQLKKKDEDIDLINKQLNLIPNLMEEVEKKTADLKRSEKEREHLREKLRKQDILSNINDTSMTSLERKRENVKLTKQIEAQNEELKQLKEEIRKLKEDSAKVNTINAVFWFILCNFNILENHG